MSKEWRVNRRIRAEQVRLIEEDGTTMVLSLEEALQRADELSSDLVEVSPNADPPVCRILDYGKYKFDQEKKRKESRKKQKITRLKEIRMQAKVSRHDLEFKSRQARAFLDEGNKVKMGIRFRGRELAHTELGRELLKEALEFIGDSATVESAPRMEGNMMSMLLVPKKR